MKYSPRDYDDRDSSPLPLFLHGAGGKGNDRAQFLQQREGLSNNPHLWTRCSKSYQSPDAVRTFDKGRVELVTLRDVTFGRATLEQGWRWSTCVKPLVNTPSCEAPHLQYHVSGRLHVLMDDGTEAEFGAGDVSWLPPGHGAWVVGNEPVVVIDISGMAEYAKPASSGTP